MYVSNKPNILIGTIFKPPSMRHPKLTKININEPFSQRFQLKLSYIYASKS